MKIYKGNDDLAHTYLVCRFNTCFLVDPASHLDEIKEDLKEYQLSFILLTHAHHDHIHLIGDFDVPIYIHQNDAHLLFEDQYNGYHPKSHPYRKKDLQLKLISDQEKIPFADHYIEVIHTPGHTKGGVCYLYQDKLFTGDTLFKESVGRHDLYSGHLPDLKKSVLHLMELNSNIKIYPGHDQPSSIRYEIKNNPFVDKWKKQFDKR